jgi:hypothetical protein
MGASASTRKIVIKDPPQWRPKLSEEAEKDRADKVTRCPCNTTTTSRPPHVFPATLTPRLSASHNERQISLFGPGRRDSRRFMHLLNLEVLLISSTIQSWPCPCLFWGLASKPGSRRPLGVQEELLAESLDPVQTSKERTCLCAYADFTDNHCSLLPSARITTPESLTRQRRPRLRRGPLGEEGEFPRRRMPVTGWTWMISTPID